MDPGRDDQLERARKALTKEASLAEDAQLEALEQLTRLAVEVTCSAASFVTLVGADHARFRWSTGPYAHFAGRGNRSALKRLLAAKAAVTFQDVRAGATIRETWEAPPLGTVALLAVPLLVDGQPRGALAVLHPVPRTWFPRDEAALVEVAKTAGTQIALARAAKAEAVRVAERAERALVESETRFRAVVENAPDAIYVVQDDRVAYANPAAVTLAGGSGPVDLLGLPARRLIELPYLKALQRCVVLDQAFPGSTHVEDTLVRLDGGRVDVEVSAHPYLLRNRPAVLVLVRDIHERKQAEAALRRREAELRLLVTQLPVFVWSTDARLRLLSSQGGTSALKPTDDAVGTPLRGLFGASAPSDAPLATQRAAAQGRSGSYRVGWHDRTYDVHVEPLRGDGGEVVGTVGAAMDVSEQVRAAEELKAAEKLAALGQIAAGVAHEMNNILGTVLATAALLEHSKGPPSAASLEALQSAARRGGAITASLLGYASGGMHRRARLPLDALVARVAVGVREAHPHLHVRWSCTAGLPDVEGDERQLEAALTNVCQNAVDAMPGGGELTITARSEEPGERPHPGLGAGRWVRVDVRDTGEGMTEEVRRRAFEPFFTTRPLGRGTGLGLSMAYGVVRNHGGELLLESEPGLGTTVTFCLPAAEAVAARSPEPRVRQAAPAAGAILVVDDDDWIRFSTGRLLEALGYEVIEAGDGATGLTAYRARGPEIVAVLLDLRMPGMDGAEVLRSLVAMDPDVRVILCTGYERDQVSQSLFEFAEVGFLGKPFGLAELKAEVQAFARAPRILA